MVVGEFFFFSATNSQNGILDCRLCCDQFAFSLATRTAKELAPKEFVEIKTFLSGPLKVGSNGFVLKNL
jgi:hypothetical protein